MRRGPVRPSAGPSSLTSNLYRGVVVEVTESGPWVTVPRLYGEQAIGPIPSSAGMELHPGDRVILGAIENRLDDLIILSNTGAVGASVEYVDTQIANQSEYVDERIANHAHSAAAVTSGTLSRDRLPDAIGAPGRTLNLSGDQIQVDGPLRLRSSADASETSTGHPLQIGNDGEHNVRYDNNEIVAVDPAGKLYQLWVPGGITAGQPDNPAALTRRDYVDGKTAPLDSATNMPTGNTLAKRHSNGSIRVFTGTAADDAANKGYVDAHNVLWEGAWYMHDGQTVPLSQNVNAQKTGIILVWSHYSGGAAQGYNWSYDFIPKWHVANANGQGILISMGSSSSNNTVAPMIFKYIYVANSTISGNAVNDDGLAAQRVLRAVIGV
ncbi:hypothetical protein ACMX2H_17475 [Arthrobacter sulfonylureivorans]|uniref:hypothetical protein n=1 Tax=Arthrobacter sulfonylureivorans TaxID=2486855 RepID=UPI0039E4D020